MTSPVVSRALFNKLLKKISKKISMRSLERHINLSEGYLSKIKRGLNEPSPSLVSLLIMLDRDLEKGLPTLRKLWTGARKEALVSKRTT